MWSYMAYTPAVATAGSILLGQGCVFWQLVVEWVYIAAQLRNLHREMENLFLRWKDHFPPVLSRRATANTIQPPVLYSVLTVLCGHNSLTNFPGYSCSNTGCTWCVEPRMAGRPLLLPHFVKSLIILAARKSFMDKFYVSSATKSVVAHSDF